MIDIDDSTFIISDTHFSHKNIVKYSYRPGFDHKYDNHDYEYHNVLMVSNWFKAVGKNDKVLHLGDVAFNKRTTEAEMYLQDLPGEKYLILGNHDKAPREWYESMGFTIIEPFHFEYDGHKVWFDHYPKERLMPKELSVYGHVHNNPHNSTFSHLNVSVEVMAYSPQRLIPLLDSLVYSTKHAR